MMSSLVIDLKDCQTVLEFLDRMVKALEIMPFYGTNLEVLGKTIASLEKHEYTFPLKFEFVNTKHYAEKCPNGWKIFLKSLQDAKKEYNNKNMKFDYQIKE